ncbi:unnamed protein product [Microthlaspi erraticum]|uniref:KIB1-4 beta-propeller domain-containing protein n=1 Tax=Microthlaspi erraticum TaxID=1685480 RepID=A0A6D2I2H3_9BRAS|nr:unnamed protein product [Microthlaspi erraticum]
MYNPSKDMTYIMKIPEITCKVNCHFKDGWLLMRKHRLSDGLFFFNAFTHELIDLPNCGYYNGCVIFTCAPTSNSYLVFGLANNVNNKNLVAINTLRLGETKWETNHFWSPKPYFACSNKVLFSRGLFYCLGKSGSLAVFNPSDRGTLTN